MLMRGRAPQGGCTPLYVAAAKGHQEVVQLLAKEGANKDAPNEVTEERGLDVGRTNSACISCRGLQHSC